MQISSLNTNVSFGRRLASNEEAEYLTTLKRAKQITGNTGMSALIVPVYSLPQSAQYNTGMGNLLGNDSSNFFDFAKKYWDINVVQILPLGQNKKQINVRPYSGSSLDLNEGLINYESLAQEKYGNLLTQQDFNDLVQANNTKDSIINYRNILEENSLGDKLLKKAYLKFKENNNSITNRLNNEFQQYTLENTSWLNPKSMFSVLEKIYNTRNYNKWDEIDKNLYSENVSNEVRSKRIQELENKYSEDIEFFKFKQFLAEKHLAEAKHNLNEKNLKLSGDMLIGVSNDEMWANPSAFRPDCTTNNWGSPALDLEKEEGINFLKLKTKLFAKRYDKIRVDAGWWYIRQVNTKKYTKELITHNSEDKILNIIENEFKKEKKGLYSPDDIMYEFAANPLTEFSMHDGSFLKPEIKDRIKIQCSNTMHKDWGTSDSFAQRGWGDSYILGITNHDSPLPIENFKNEARKKEQIEALADALNIDPKILNNFKEFKNAKYAEIMRAKNNMFFFLDSLNIAGKYKDNVDKNKDYMIKIPSSYQDDYFKSLEKNEGLNIMDAMDKAFVANGYDQEHPELYKKILKFKNILKGNEKKWYKNKWVMLEVIATIGIATTLILYLNKHSKSSNPHPNKT